MRLQAFRFLVEVKYPPFAVSRAELTMKDCQVMNRLRHPSSPEDLETQRSCWCLLRGQLHLDFAELANLQEQRDFDAFPIPS